MFDAAMAGVMGGDLAEDFGEATLTIFGPVAALGGDGTEKAVPGGGAFEYGLRQSIMYVVGGGTNDVQRGLIARGLGLPR
jgi:alkylation response protein AidB-like acyl-CoA dehydrogenase